MPAELHQHTPFSREIPPRLRQKPKHKNLQKARSKHNAPATPPSSLQQPSPFFDSFFALPTEIRLEIYRHLLVRPCKFDLAHRDGCDGEALVNPWSRLLKGTDNTRIMCAECNNFEWKRYDIDRIFDCPTRSQWALPKKNPYICEHCYADKQIEFGMEKVPDLRRVDCLCARRENLSVLLINRRVYEEAAPIFWKENTFAFESGRLLFDFLEAVGAEKREMIRSIACYSPDEDPIDMEEMPQCWPLLRQCTALRELELDASFLSDLPSVLEMASVRVPSARFVENGSWNAYYDSREQLAIWPWVACRVDQPSGLAKKLITGMKDGDVCEGCLRRLYAERRRQRQIAAAQLAEQEDAAELGFF
ncbi:hypothetical protein BJY04DRAFT_38839 [Aspergillus karnatakaensis]|uniref:uncharacterized protein n=1 Tax=Aspergillus karnatakaensis TaxID=1810916 RepID=UPI003CCC9E0A